jgi:CRISPR-associated protein Csb2
VTTELVLRFPLGRYHATPWGTNLNEGAVEWPPSPWRLLRALYASWRNRVPHLDGDIVLGLLDQLAQAPVYVIPPHARAHTRHFVPGPAHKEGVATDRTKVLDAFVAVSPSAELVVRWPVDLDGEQRDVFEVLVAHLTYLGRAESACEAEARFGSFSEPVGTSCAPLPDDSGESRTIDVLVPIRPLDEGALTVTTSALRGTLRRREPPGAKRVRYPRPVERSEGTARRPSRSSGTVTTVRWALATPAPPSRHAAVAWADTLRMAALSAYGGADRRPAPPVLSGRADDGAPQRGRHGHVHWLAFGDRCDRRMSSVAAWAPDGFDDEVVDALASIPRLYRSGIGDVRPSALGVEGWGTAPMVVPELVGPSSVWESYTPFSPSRHRKGGGFQAHVLASVRQELEWRGLPAADVEFVKGGWAAFRTHRPSGERLRDARRATGLRLRFDAPVCGPLALGALCHFGLGLFLPVEDGA